MRINLTRTLIALPFAAFLAAGCSIGTSAPAAPNSQSVQQVTAGAAQLATLISTGQYKAAYAMRSTKCQAVISEEEYENGIRNLYGVRRDLVSIPPSIVVTSADADRAAVQVIYHDEPAALSDDRGPRRWVKENGTWKFDNCE
ncbi:hypothetical protein F3087_19735 [Nocardia colli]|uniref:DUF4878 domain-containing protein n=1 Tax=Nocardia colli TaxID=2545717 RepID=A0A5N0EF22_9NOCA|nr:hypothetical protein [Nocardia colli]KAA8887139.1 hypothetical protein F3087_19735 [Nocardia colli]